MLTATILTDAHKYGPAHYGFPATYMSHDNDDHRDTMATPPPSADDIETNPHASVAPLSDTDPPDADDAAAERAMRTMIPTAGATPKDLALASDSVLFDAIRQVSEAARILREGREERELFERDQRLGQAEILTAVLRADQNGQANYAMLRNELLALKESDRHQNARLAEGDERFARIEQSISDLKVELLALVSSATADAAERIARLENELARARNDAAATTATT